MFADIHFQTAYWIAFGPHGPRAEPPPGMAWDTFKYTTLGILISIAIFGVTRFFARPPPKTMSKEWQEATNEYAKVNFLLFVMKKFAYANHCAHRVSIWSLSPVSLLRAIKAQDLYRASRQASRWKSSLGRRMSKAKSWSFQANRVGCTLMVLSTYAASFSSSILPLYRL